MTVPTYDQFIEPILRFLAVHTDGKPARDAHEAAAVVLAISDEDRQVLLPSGTQPIYKNRAGWAHDRLKRAGLSSSPRRGFWQLTAKGHEYIEAHADALAPHEIEQLARDFMDVLLKPAAISGATVSPMTKSAVASPVAVASPDDRLGQAIAELRSAVAALSQPNFSTRLPRYPRHSSKR